MKVCLLALLLCFTVHCMPADDNSNLVVKDNAEDTPNTKAKFENEVKSLEDQDSKNSSEDKNVKSKEDASLKSTEDHNVKSPEDASLKSSEDHKSSEEQQTAGTTKSSISKTDKMACVDAACDETTTTDTKEWAVLKKNKVVIDDDSSNNATTSVDGSSLTNATADNNATTVDSTTGNTTMLADNNAANTTSDNTTTTFHLTGNTRDECTNAACSADGPPPLGAKDNTTINASKVDKTTDVFQTKNKTSKFKNAFLKKLAAVKGNAELKQNKTKGVMDQLADEMNPKSYADNKTESPEASETSKSESSAEVSKTADSNSEADQPIGEAEKPLKEEKKPEEGTAKKNETKDHLSTLIKKLTTTKQSDMKMKNLTANATQEISVRESPTVAQKSDCTDASCSAAATVDKKTAGSAEKLDQDNDEEEAKEKPAMDLEQKAKAEMEQSKKEKAKAMEKFKSVVKEVAGKTAKDETGCTDESCSLALSKPEEDASVEKEKDKSEEQEAEKLASEFEQKSENVTAGQLEKNNSTSSLVDNKTTDAPADNSTESVEDDATSASHSTSDATNATADATPADATPDSETNNTSTTNPTECTDAACSALKKSKDELEHSLTNKTFTTATGLTNEDTNPATEAKDHVSKQLHALSNNTAEFLSEVLPTKGKNTQDGNKKDECTDAACSIPGGYTIDEKEDFRSDHHPSIETTFKRVHYVN